MSTKYFYISHNFQITRRIFSHIGTKKNSRSLDEVGSLSTNRIRKAINVKKVGAAAFPFVRFVRKIPLLFDLTFNIILLVLRDEGSWSFGTLTEQTLIYIFSVIFWNH